MENMAYSVDDFGMRDVATLNWTVKTMLIGLSLESTRLPVDVVSMVI